MFKCTLVVKKSSLGAFFPQVQADVAPPTPRIDEVLTQFRDRNRVLNVSAEAPVQECSVRGGSATGNQTNEVRIKKLEQQVSQLLKKVPEDPAKV